MSSQETVKAAIAKLDAQIKNYYKSADEALYTSIGSMVVSIAIFVICSKLLISSVNLQSLIGIGGGGTTGFISLSWGYHERLVRREKARQIEAQKICLENLGEISADLDKVAQDQILNDILKLTLRTISAPYDFSRTKTERTE